MEDRYQVGFPEGVTCMVAEAIPDWVPVVDMGTAIHTGVLVALAPYKVEAEKIAKALNSTERMKALWEEIGRDKN